MFEEWLGFSKHIKKKKEEMEMEEQLTSVNHINVRVVLRSIFCNI